MFFPGICNVEHFFMYSLAICISSLEKHLFKSLPIFKLKIFLLLICQIPLYILIITHHYIYKYLTIPWFPFHFAYNFCWLNILHLPPVFWYHIQKVIYKVNVVHLVLSFLLRVSELLQIFLSLTHFKLIFNYGIK